MGLECDISLVVAEGVRKACKVALEFEQAMERVNQVAERSKDTHFFRTPFGVQMGSKGDQFVGRTFDVEPATAEAKRKHGVSEGVISWGSMEVNEKGEITEMEINGEKVENTGTGFPNPGFNIEDMIAAAKESEDALKDWMKTNTPRPCPAVLSVMGFAHAFMEDHFVNLSNMAMEAGDIRGGIQGLAVAQAINASFEQISKSVDFDTVPPLNFEILHQLLSASNTQWVCDVQAEANREAGYNAEEGAAVIQEILSRMPGKEDRNNVKMPYDEPTEDGAAEG